MAVPKTNSEAQHLTLWTPNKGQFSDRNEIDIPPGGAKTTNNVVFLDGVIRPRPGCVQIYGPAPIAAVVASISETSPLYPNTAKIMAVHRSGGDLRFFEYSGAWVERLGSAPLVGAGLGEHVPAQAVNFQGGWFFIGGTHDLVYKPSGGTTIRYVDLDQPRTDLQPPDDPRVLAVFADRLLLANFMDPDNPGVRLQSGLAWSDHNKPLVWGSGQGAGTANRTVLGQDSAPITAIHAWSDIITAFTARSIYQGKFVGGTRVFSFDILVDGAGCVSAGTLCRYTLGRFIWLGPNNVYMGRAGEAPIPIGDSIKTRLGDLIYSAASSSCRALCDRVNDLYWLFIPSADPPYPDKIFVCNLRDGAWYEGLLTEGARAVGEENTDIWGTKLLLGLQSGKIMHFSFDAFDDDGVDFPATWESGTFSVEKITGGKSQQCIISRARVFSNIHEGEVDISVSTGNSLDYWAETDFGTQTFDTTEDEADNVLVERTDSGEFFKFQFTFASVAAAAHVQGCSLSLIFGGDTR